MDNVILLAAAGTGFTFLMTCLGAATVFFMRKNGSPRGSKIFMGFASGVMIAASVWSLLIPAIDMAVENGQTGYIEAAGGFTLGAVFLFVFDRIISKLSRREMTDREHSTSVLITAITLHNIPEGMAVGLSFALAALANDGSMAFAPAAALALGIGIQNFPEGAAVSLPLLENGKGKFSAFVKGCLSGVVEPIFGVITVLVASQVAFYLPWLLSFAAGAMIFAVVKELIPEACSDNDRNPGTMGAMVGFLIMMVLDVALG